MKLSHSDDNILGDDAKSVFRLFWKNGGRMTLVIAVTVILLCFVSFQAVMPVLKQERIRNVRSEVIQLSDKFVNISTGVRFEVLNSILKNKEILSCPDSALSVCSEIMGKYEHISGVSIAYMKDFPNGMNMRKPFVYKGRVEEGAIDLCDPEYENQYSHNFVYLLSFFENHPFEQGNLGHPRILPFSNVECIPFTMPVSFDYKTIDAFITTYIESDTLRNQFEAFNPYPGGTDLMIHTLDSLFTIAPCDTLVNKAAFPWLKEYYGENVVSKLLSIPEDEVITFSDENLTFFAGSIYYGQRIFLYAVPTSVLTEDLSNIFINILVLCIVGFILISLVCIHTTRNNSHIALIREVARKEMQTTADIQKGMLSKMPEGLTSVGIDALLVPAKAVGGDLYYCLRRDNLLYFCVGDVSGKGMPAAMFMARTISLFKHISRSAVSADEIAEKLNTELILDNGTDMFVTFFIGILDIRTGVLKFCNAGHNEPLFWTGDSSAAPEFLHTCYNIPLGIESTMPFTGGEMSLPTGSVLMLYTDGVTEAMNENHEQYGQNRLSSLFKTAGSETAESINASLLDNVRAFAGKREQSDDITILTIKFKSVDQTIKFTEDPESLGRLKPFFDKIDETLLLEEESCTMLRAAVDEAVTNVVRHGFVNHSADLIPQITLCAKTSGGKLCFTIEDNGIPFNPLTYTSTNIDDIPGMDIIDMQIGGLGIPMIRMSFDELRYERIDGHNILKLIKLL